MFQNDLKIKISTGSSRKSKTWLKQEMYWSDFVEKLEHPIRTEETLAEYMGYRKAKQDKMSVVSLVANFPENSEEMKMPVIAI